MSNTNNMSQDTNMVDSFLSDKKDYIEKRTEELIKAIIELELEKKEIDLSIKVSKAEAKDDGVDIRVVTTVLSKIKARLKKKPNDQDDEDKMEELLLSKAEIIDSIYMLVKPSK